MLAALFLLTGIAVTLCALFAIRQRLGFGAQTPADYKAQGPLFDPRHQLSGPILCEGVIFGPTGRVASRFVADIQGTWSGNTGTLTESFRYDSGRVQTRCWTLTLGPTGQITATAPDVVGVGRGTAAGPAMQLRYAIRLDADAGGHVLNVIDWMYLMENGTIINRSQFRKFGITVAELVATLRKV